MADTRVCPILALVSALGTFLDARAAAADPILEGVPTSALDVHGLVASPEPSPPEPSPPEPSPPEPELRTATEEIGVAREARDDSGATLGMAEFGAGIIVLPGGKACADPKARCNEGDSSLAFEGWPLLRRGHFAAGAGITMGVTSSTSGPVQETPVRRDHYRRYLTIEATARYYLTLSERFEIWAGVTTGLAVVNDTFQSQEGLTDKALVGPRGATLLTDGLSIGGALGLTYTIARHWRIGTGVRFSNWFLPRDPTRDPLGDYASLTGRVTAIDLGLTLAYRSRLVF